MATNRLKFSPRIHVPFFPWVLSTGVNGDVAVLFHLLLCTGWTRGAPQFWGGEPDDPKEIVTPVLRIGQLAKRFGKSQKTIQRWLVECERAGLLERVHVRGHENRFVLHVPGTVLYELQGLRRRAQRHMAAWSLRPAKTRRLRVGPSVMGSARRYNPRVAMAWYYQTVQQHTGTLPPGSRGDLYIQFHRHIAAPIYDTDRPSHADYDDFYKVMNHVILRWKEWKKLAKRRGLIVGTKYPPLGFARSWWMSWQQFAGVLKTVRRAQPTSGTGEAGF